MDPAPDGPPSQPPPSSSSPPESSPPPPPASSPPPPPPSPAQDAPPAQDAAAPKPPDFGIWFAGACVAVVGLLFFAYQSRRQRQAEEPDTYGFGGARAGLVNIPQGGNSSMPGISVGETAPTSLTPSTVVPLRKPLSPGAPAEAIAGSPGEIFSQTLAAHRDFYSGLAQRHLEESAVVRRFFDDWRRSPDLARLSAEYAKDQDAIKFARGAAGSPDFSRLMKRYTLEGDMRNYGMELLMGSPHEVMVAWTNYASKDPEGSALQTALFEAMGVPPTFAQVLGNGQTDAAQMEAQVKAMLPALLKGVDPKLLQQAQQMSQQQPNSSPQH